MGNAWDTIDWAAFDGAYGPATETPGILAAIASEDPEVADDGRFEFYSSLHHQGTVYAATVQAVPFLIELAVRPGVHQRDHLLRTVGALCDPQQTNGEQRAVHAAVARLSGLLLPALDDPDPGVREAAAYALAHADSRHVPALAARRASETVPVVRASLLLGTAPHPPGLLRDALTEPFPVPAAAAVLLARARHPLTADQLTRVYATTATWQGPWSDTVSGRPGDLTRFLDLDGLTTLTDALTTGPARRDLAHGLADRFRSSRAAASALAGRLAPLLADPEQDVRSAAVDAALAAGTACAVLADALATLAADPVGDAPDEALGLLIRLRDPRWSGLLVSAWERGRDPQVTTLFGDISPPYDAEILHAVRRRLRMLAGEPEAGKWAAAPQVGLVQLLGGWGPAAADAVPEIIAAYERAFGVAADALASIGPSALSAVSMLKDRALGGDLRAGHAVWRLTGETEALVSAVLAKRGRGAAWDLRRAGEAGTALAPAVPRLREWLAQAGDADERIMVARALWRATGDPAEALPTLTEVLAGGHPGAGAGLAAEIGTPEHRPHLRRMLRHQPWHVQVDAIRALHRLGVPAEELTAPLLDLLDRASDIQVNLLVEMRAVTAIPALTALAEQPERVVRSGFRDYPWQDDALRERLRAAVAALSA
ncbi:hypothetical protein [Catenuloplanes indicus]|uniref:HEAT repeat protein n=1 Tax=Catenuloplanes indicus TaxID=137267 RepID=A0AAE3VWH1_9ACTN|nr:hypothetical protein [Catenuloplanes indicus]MDQ0365019.1 HEAT repeat protein [Catenuloplanes indicus]